MIEYPVFDSGQRILFSQEVIEHFKGYRQVRWWQREAGGQLFARLALPYIHVERITGPRFSDQRTRFTYRPNRAAEQREINAQHRQGFHFVGDWHTHPESHPTQSSSDSSSMHELFNNSQHPFDFLLLVIVGTEPIPTGMKVLAYTGYSFHELHSAAKLSV